VLAKANGVIATAGSKRRVCPRPGSSTCIHDRAGSDRYRDKPRDGRHRPEHRRKRMAKNKPPSITHRLAVDATPRQKRHEPVDALIDALVKMRPQRKKESC